MDLCHRNTFILKNGVGVMRMYLEMFKVELKTNIAYRFQIWARLLGDVVFVAMWYYVWKALYSGVDDMHGKFFSETILYVIAAQFLITINNSGSPLWGMDYDISNGNIAYELIKPYNFIAKKLTQCVSSSISVFLLSSMWVFSVTFFVLNVELPSSIVTWIMFLISFVAGYLIRFFIELSFSFLSFWVLHIGGIRALFTFLISLFSGSVIPLWFFPKGVRYITDILPFKYIYFVPCDIISNYKGVEVSCKYILVQFIWVIISILIAGLVWKKGIKKLIIQGG